MISKNMFFVMTLIIVSPIRADIAFADGDFNNLSVHDQLVVDGTTHLRGELRAHKIHVHHETNTRDLNVRDKAKIHHLKAKKISAKKIKAKNAQFDNLTVFDSAIISNLSLTDASVSSLDIIGDLTVGGDVLVDGAVSACDVIVDCNILMNDSSGLAVGNILKNGTIFVHNNGVDNTFVGKNAGNPSNNLIGSGNVGAGVNALALLDAGIDNVAVGVNALAANAVGNNVTAIGTSALAANTVDENTAVGAFALTTNTTGIDNTSLGAFSLTLNTIGSSNTATGSEALSANISGSGNSAFGSGALQLNTSNSNSAFGTVALATNSTGDFNAAFGAQALNANDTGVENTALGTSALLQSTDNNNTAVGSSALSALATGSNNIAMGQLAGSVLGAGSNNMYIGNQGAVSESATIRIGTNLTHTATFIAGISGATVVGGSTVLINPAGQLGTIVSSRRFKNHIQDIGSASDLLMKLRPVMFNYNSDDTNQINYGFIAEEVAQIYPELVVFDEEGNPYTVKYHLLYALLLNEIQKNHVAIDDLQDERELVQQLLARVVALEQVVNSRK